MNKDIPLSPPLRVHPNGPVNCLGRKAGCRKLSLCSRDFIENSIGPLGVVVHNCSPSPQGADRSIRNPTPTLKVRLLIIQLWKHVDQHFGVFHVTL